MRTVQVVGYQLHSNGTVVAQEVITDPSERYARRFQRGLRYVTDPHERDRILRLFEA